MRGVSRHSRRFLAATALVSIVFAHAVAAAEHDGWSGRLFDKFSKAKQFIITVYSRLGTPPG